MEAECLCPGYGEMADIICTEVFRDMEVKVYLDGFKVRSVQQISVACVPFLFIN
jgi:hypothetical protein